MSKINLEDVLIGSDIEVFLANDEKYISSVGRIEGTKNEPYPLVKEGCCTQLDNVSTEFNVPPVALIGGGPLMVENILFVFDYLKDKFSKENLKPVCCASADFTLDELTSIEAQTFGCDPDFNAWLDGEPNPKKELENPYMRCAGGHIHIGYPKSNDKLNMQIIKCLDITLGVPSIFLDEDRTRRTLYGQAGSFRHKPYGVEYRALSNFWCENPEYVEWIFEGVKKALDMVNNHAAVDSDVTDVMSAVNCYDEQAANRIMEKYGISVPSLLPA